MYQQESDLAKNLCENMKKENSPNQIEPSQQKHGWLFRASVCAIVGLAIVCTRMWVWLDAEIDKHYRIKRITQFFQGIFTQCYHIFQSISSYISRTQWYSRIKNNSRITSIYLFLELPFYKFIQSSLYRQIKTNIEKKLLQLSPKIPSFKTVGLKNIGNTCYMNSILQCLINLNKFNGKLTQQIAPLEGNPISENLSQQYKTLLEYVWKSQNRHDFQPRRLKQFVSIKKDRFRGNKQQDAHEFLSSFLQIVGEQLIRVKTTPKYKKLENDPKKKSAIKLSEQWWQYQKSRQDSVIYDNFQGQTVSAITCQGCEKQTLTFNNTIGLPLSMSDKIQSISELILNDWKTSIEIEGYYCSSCKEQHNCTQIVEIFKLPQILVIHLKRFAEFQWTRQKIQTPVQIDEIIDFEKVMHKEAPQRKPTYQLTGIVNHYGGLQSGHYTACVYNKNEQKWYLANDSTVSETHLQRTSKSAYLLFYERI